MKSIALITALVLVALACCTIVVGSDAHIQRQAKLKTVDSLFAIANTYAIVSDQLRDSAYLYVVDHSKALLFITASIKYNAEALHYARLSKSKLDSLK